MNRYHLKQGPWVVLLFSSLLLVPCSATLWILQKMWLWQHTFQGLTHTVCCVTSSNFCFPCLCQRYYRSSSIPIISREEATQTSSSTPTIWGGKDPVDSLYLSWTRCHNWKTLMFVLIVLLQTAFSTRASNIKSRIHLKTQAQGWILTEFKLEICTFCHPTSIVTHCM